MENSEVKSVGAEISKKSRSLDLKSIYKSGVLKEGHSKGKSDVRDDDEVRKKKRKSRKKVALSSFEPVGKRSRNSFDEVNVDRLSLGSGDSDRLLSGFSQKLNSGGRLNGISLNLDGNGNVIRIPKRRRGSVGRRKFESNHVSKPSGSSSSVDQIAKLNGERKSKANEQNQTDELKSNSAGKVVLPKVGSSSSVDQIAKLNGERKGKASKQNQIAELKSNSAGKVVNPKVGSSSSVDEIAKLNGERKSKNSQQNQTVELKSNSAGKVLPKVGSSSSVDQIAKLNGERKGKASQQNQISELKSNSAGKVVIPKVGSSNSVDEIAKLNGERKSKNSQQKQIVELDSNSAGNAVIPKAKRKSGFDDSKENRTVKVKSVRDAKKEGGGHLLVNNGDASSRKSQSSHRKRKDLASGSETVAKKVEPSVDDSGGICDDFQDDDEENLEQNAARMLSSRFDPSCTGFSSKSRTSESPSSNGLSFVIPSGRDFGNRGLNALDGLESASADAANRVLRPRKKHREKGLSRKRRHFYEIRSSGLDAQWFLNRRIKVFWPLDESWYFGLVNDYDPERKLHHIKYDDRDEEWINLQNERFKLLLLPSEVPGSAEPEKSAMQDKHADTERRDTTMADDAYMESHMDSEPIISWLTSSRRVKSSPSRALKKQKTSHLPSNFVSPDRIVDTGEGSDGGLLERETSKSCSTSVLPERLVKGGRGEKSVSESTTSSRENKFPIVYVRRRRKNSEGVCPSVNVNACGGVPGYVSSLGPIADISQTSKSIQWMDVEERLLSINENDAGMLNLSMALIESKQFRFELRPLLEYIFGAEIFRLFHTALLFQYGTVVTMWPKVHLEVLFVDNGAGLRFFLFDGCLKQAVELVFFVLTVFHKPIKQKKCIDLQMPVTSIRFKLSSVRDLTKHQVFEYYSFSKVKGCKWLYLDCKLQRHCLLTKQLPLPECTYDNIKALEDGHKQLHMSYIGSQPSFEVLEKQSVQGIVPIGVSKETSPANWNSHAKHGIPPPFALSFTAAPTFFLSLHLKLLIEHSIASVSLRDHDSVYSLEHSGNTYRSIVEDCTEIECCSDDAPENNQENILGTTSTETACSGWLSHPKSQLGVDAVYAGTDGGVLKSSRQLQNGKANVAATSNCCQDSGSAGIDANAQLQKLELKDLESEEFVSSLRSLVPKNITSPVMSSARCYSSFDGMHVEIPPFDQVERNGDGKTEYAEEASDMAWNMSDSIACSPNPTGPRSLWHSNRNSSTSLPLGDLSHVWSDGKTNYIHNGFGNGPKKPRTQVQYTSPFGGFDFSSKHKIPNQNGLPYKRIRRANEKRTSDGSRSTRRNLELLACDANVLITLADRGWREGGARVVLELADHNEWKLAIKVSGTTKYSYKVHHVLQWSTNRYTHAMMWKGGKDWILEFPDRGQWVLFKEMHEECFNRNIRAASVKNIPIPGVRLIEESDDNATEVPFIRSSPMYFQQVETDVDMAMDPSRVLYDMDSDDEQWVVKTRKSSQTQERNWEEISDECFERTMDMFEKVAYTKQRDHFTADEMEELMHGVGSIEVIKVIYEHWQQKRQRKGMPLIRQLQPPSWEKYQQQLKEWEQSVNKTNTTPSSGCQDRTPPPSEKPPMFAFCLKPRGLEVPNSRGTKHRSLRRFSVSGHSHAVPGDHDGLHAFGRRLNGFAFGDEKVMYPGNGHESLDASPLLQPTTRVYLPRDAGPGYFSLSSGGSEWNHHPKLHRNKSKKIATFLTPSNPQTTFLTPSNPQTPPSYNQRTMGKRNGAHRWNMGLPDWPPSQKHHHQPEGSHRHGIDGSDLDEFRLRDASGAAQHALNMAKLKREKAQRLLYRADLAIHKAVVALMAADAIKASHEESNGDDG